MTNMLTSSSAPAGVMDRIEHLSLSSRVYQSLRDSLSIGELVPGQKLTGRLLAEKLGVSQTPVREAMLQLVAERALVLSPNRSISVPTLTLAKFIELRDMRVALERLATRCAVENAQAADIEAIAAIHAAMAAAKAAGDSYSTLTHNRRFHFALYGLSGRDELVAMIQSLWVRTGPYLNMLWRSDVTWTTQPHAHEALIEGLRAGNADQCEEAIARDIVIAGQPILDALQTTPP